MFESPDAARAALDKAFEPPFVAAALQALIPAIRLAPNDRATHPGATHIGGTPDLPPGLDWPRPDPVADVEDLARRGNNEAAAEMRADLARNPPFAFVAQIDLAEAATLGPVAADLPSEGRLLVFYDLAVGPWDSGPRVARVLWDRLAAEALRPVPIPPELRASIEAFRTTSAAAFAKHGLPPPPADAATIYAGPARAMALRTAFALPSPQSFDAAAVPALPSGSPAEMNEDETELYFAYCEFRDEHATAQNRHQLLGAPAPEQDDPRYDAANLALFGKPHVTGENFRAQRERIEAEARYWRLLFQLDISDWMQDDLAEGTVYFLIRTADLAARRFESVVAIYQQT